MPFASGRRHARDRLAGKHPLTPEALADARRLDLVWRPLAASTAGAAALWAVGVRDPWVIGFGWVFVLVALSGSAAFVVRRPWALATDAEVQSIARLTLDSDVHRYVRELQLMGREVVEADVQAVLLLIDESRPVTRFMSTLAPDTRFGGASSRFEL